MSWFILKHIFSTILSIINITRLSNQEKDLEILILRQQLSILQRKHNSPIKLNRVEKITLAVLTARLKSITHRSANQLRDIIRIFQPETILRWHRELVRRKWTYPHKNKGGRPSISKELEELILRLAHENPRWGYGKIQGELVKLSFKVSQSTVRNILERHGIQPVPVRNSSIGWRHLMTHYKNRSWRAIFSLSIPSGFRPSMCSSSLNWVRDAFILLMLQAIPIKPGLLNKPGNWFGNYTIGEDAYNS